MNAKERFTSWQKDVQAETEGAPEPAELEKASAEPQVPADESAAEKVFAEVLEADKNRPALVACDKETWPEVKKMMNAAKIKSRYNHNTIKLY